MNMDPKNLFWALALLHMAFLVGCAVAGWWAIRRGDLARHRRLMNIAVVLVLVFVAGYLVKVLTLGKEDLDTWSDPQLWTLWTHETLVAIMLLAGGRARWLARRLAEGHRAAAGLRRSHRRAGKTAMVAAIFALFTAGLVLLGMLQSTPGG